MIYKLVYKAYINKKGTHCFAEQELTPFKFPPLNIGHLSSSPRLVLVNKWIWCTSYKNKLILECFL